MSGSPCPCPCAGTCRSCAPTCIRRCFGLDSTPPPSTSTNPTDGYPLTDQTQTHTYTYPTYQGEVVGTDLISTQPASQPPMVAAAHVDGAGEAAVLAVGQVGEHEEVVAVELEGEPVPLGMLGTPSIGGSESGESAGSFGSGGSVSGSESSGTA